MITIHIEKLANTLPELMPLLPVHYEELALDKDHVPLDPMYDVYLAREAQGQLLLVVMRDAGEIVGYFIGFIAPGLHYKTCLTCIQDIFYVRRDKRDGTQGIRLFSFIKKELKRRGVKRWFMGSKMHADASPLFEKMGARKVETTHSLWLGD